MRTIDWIIPLRDAHHLSVRGIKLKEPLCYVCFQLNGILIKPLRRRRSLRSKETDRWNKKLRIEKDQNRLIRKDLEFLSERYRLISELGSGGMGTVFKAHDCHLDKDVAIKVINASLEQESYAIEFQKEAKALCRLKNENLVGVYDFGVGDNNTLYMVQEYMQGKTLKDLLSEKGRLSIDEAIAIFIQIANGMFHAHQNGVIHRDLKPDNIIIGHSRENSLLVKIIDFGIAHIEDQETTTTKTGVIKGSPYYLAPEVINGEKADEKSDIYAFGCLMFKTITGSVPFKGKNIFDTFKQHTSEAIPEIVDLVEDCPEALNEIAFQCMEKRPEDRIQSIDLVKQNLEEILYSDKNDQDESYNLQHRVKIIDRFKIRVKNTPWPLIATSIVLFLVSCLALSPLFLEAKKKKTVLEVIKEKSAKDSKPLTVLPANFDRMVDGTAPVFRAETEHGPCWRRMEQSITDEELALFLSKVPQFDLDLNHTNITGAGLIVIRHWKINRIELDSTKLNDAGMKNVCAVKSLKYLNLRDTRITDRGLSYITNLPELRSLNIENMKKLTGAGLSGLNKDSKLSKLVASHSALKDEALQYLSRVKALQTLELGGTDITDRGLSYLRGMPNLSFLELSYCKGVHQAEVIKILDSCKSLHSLKLKALKFDSKIIPHLISLAPTRLQIADTGLKNEDIVKLARIPNLQEIDFSFNGVSEETFETFARLPNMQKIYIKQPHPEVSNATIDKYRKKLQIRERDGKLPLPLKEIQSNTKDIEKLLFVR